MLVMRWDQPRREWNAGNDLLNAAWCSFDWVDPEQQGVHIRDAPQVTRRRLFDEQFVSASLQRLREAFILNRSVEADVYLSAILAEFSHAAGAVGNAGRAWPQRIRDVCYRIQEQPEHACPQQYSPTSMPATQTILLVSSGRLRMNRLGAMLFTVALSGPGICCIIRITALETLPRYLAIATPLLFQSNLRNLLV
jgi:hypothetical protein